jgi:hypothetical protein
MSMRVALRRPEVERGRLPGPPLTVTRTQGTNRALKDGRVAPDDFSFVFEEVPVLVQPRFTPTRRPCS